MPKIAFFGTPAFAAESLKALCAAGFTPQVVITAPDKPQGRKQIVTPSAVKTWATEYGLPIETPASLKDFSLPGDWDLFIIVAYGKLIPNRLLALPAFGALNVHGSLLPHLRGASPIQGALLEGYKETGITIMQIDAEMDHGPIVAQEACTIGEHETYQTLHDALAEKGAALLAKIVPDWITGKITAQEQNHAAATYTKKISTKDAEIDLATMSPEEVDRRIRALNPNPGTFTYFTIKGKSVRTKLLEAHLENGELILDTVQPEGKTPVPWKQFKERVQ